MKFNLTTNDVLSIITDTGRDNSLLQRKIICANELDGYYVVFPAKYDDITELHGSVFVYPNCSTKRLKRSIHEWSLAFGLFDTVYRIIRWDSVPSSYWIINLLGEACQHLLPGYETDGLIGRPYHYWGVDTANLIVHSILTIGHLLFDCIVRKHVVVSEYIRSQLLICEECYSKIVQEDKLRDITTELTSSDPESVWTCLTLHDRR